MRLEGELPVAELDLDGVDELIQVEGPLCYAIEAQKIENGVLAQGNLQITLKCECARCLKAFPQRLELKDWTCHLILEGEDKVLVANDCVDLTPYLREDILLEFPRHPLCKADCGGLPGKAIGKTKKTIGTSQAKVISPDWAELNKLKF